jgi:hypothetical protein
MHDELPQVDIEQVFDLLRASVKESDVRASFDPKTVIESAIDYVRSELAKAQ